MRVSLWMALALTWSLPAMADDDANAQIVKALDLPARAQELRRDGVPEADVRTAIQAAHDKNLSAADTAQVLKDSDDQVKEHGPIDNFGAFVQSKLDQGLRGQDLAAAIRDEHAARGKKGGAADTDHGKPDDAGRPEGDEHGKPEGDEHGKPEGDEHGKPDDKGAPADKGGPADKSGRPGDAGKPGAGAGAGAGAGSKDKDKDDDKNHGRPQ